MGKKSQKESPRQLPKIPWSLRLIWGKDTCGNTQRSLSKDPYSTFIAFYEIGKKKIHLSDVEYEIWDVRFNSSL
jgi:hypothetical protein